MEEEHPNKVAQEVMAEMPDNKKHVVNPKPIVINKYPPYHKPLKRPHAPWSKNVVDKNCVNKKLNAINHQYIYPRRMHNIVQGCTMLRKNIPRSLADPMCGLEGFGLSDLNNDKVIEILLIIVLICVLCYLMKDKKNTT
jgi:hypothetical protein